MTVSQPTVRAESPQRHEFQTLNALRGVAALTILAWHFAPLNTRGADHYWAAYLAVDLFFLLSGAVIAHVYEARLRAGWSVWRFLIARMIRLWPLYLLGTAIGAATILAVTYAAGAAPWQFKPLLVDGVRALFLWPRLNDAGVAFPYNPPGWSLFCELIVNIAYGAIGYRLSDRALAGAALLGLFAAALGCGLHVGLGDGLNFGALGTHWWIGLARALFGFSVGVLVYRWWAAERLLKFRPSPILILFGFLLSLTIAPESPALKLVGGLAVVGILWPLIVVAAIQVEPRGWQLQLARVSAELSFTIYAIHDALYMAAGAVADRLQTSADMTFGIAALMTVAMAPAANRFIDRPVRRWLTRIATMPGVAATQAAPL